MKKKKYLYKINQKKLQKSEVHHDEYLKKKNKNLEKKIFKTKFCLV